MGSRPGAVGIVGQSTYTLHVEHDVSEESVLAVGVPRGAARHPRGEVMLG